MRQLTDARLEQCILLEELDLCVYTMAESRTTAPNIYTLPLVTLSSSDEDCVCCLCLPRE